MSLRITWIAVLVTASLVFGSVAAWALIDPTAPGAGSFETPALYGP